jgi:hypothetical protein
VASPTLGSPTPGPWRIGDQSTTVNGWATYAIEEADLGEELAYVLSIEDARLIAAAPDLLDLARSVVELVEGVGHFAFEDTDFVINELRAAIAKAEGRNR